MSILSIRLHFISNIITGVADFLCHLLILAYGTWYRLSSLFHECVNSKKQLWEWQATSNWPAVKTRQRVLYQAASRFADGTSTAPCSLCLSPHNSVSLVFRQNHHTPCASAVICCFDTVSRLDINFLGHEIPRPSSLHSSFYGAVVSLLRVLCSFGSRKYMYMYLDDDELYHCPCGWLPVARCQGDPCTVFIQVRTCLLQLN